MRSLTQFIVKPVEGRRYANTKEIGGIDLIISTSEEDHTVSNRFGIVIEVPVNYDGDISEGDILLVHHNVFKFYNDMQGKRRSGKSYFMDDMFFIDPDQFYLYQKDGIWYSYDRYCFVEPIPAKESFVMKVGKNEPLIGRMKYVNNYLSSKGIKNGDIVSFTPESEYEFMVDGVKLYRIYDHQITIKF